MIARSSRRLGLAASVFAAAASFWLLVPAASARVLVVLSDESAGYKAVADELRAGLGEVRADQAQIDVVTVEGLTRVAAPAFEASELVVTVGLAAAQGVIARARPLPEPPFTLSLLIPRQGFELLALPKAGMRERRSSAVFIDQPLSRQLDLLGIALPDKRRIGAILGPTSRELRGELDTQARERALSLSVVEVNSTSDVYAALRSVMPKSDLLLVLPDPVATSRDSVHGLLLTSYRAQIPVVGFSEGLVKAGALLSLFSTASQQGRQGAEIARRVLSGKRMPEPGYPKYFTVRVNTSVARSLGLRIESEQVLNKVLIDQAVGASARPQERP